MKKKTKKYNKTIQGILIRQANKIRRLLLVA